MINRFHRIQKMGGSRKRTCTCEYITDHGEIEHAHNERLRTGYDLQKYVKSAY